MKRKILMALLALTMCLGLVACGDSDEKAGSVSKKEETQLDSEKEESKKEDSKKDKKEVVISEDDNFKFSIKSVESDGGYYTLECFIENKTDKNLMFAWDEVSVNDMMIDPYWACGVSSGKSSNTDIYFDEEDFEKNDIEEVESIEFRLRVYDDDNYDSDYLCDEVFVFNPQK